MPVVRARLRGVSTALDTNGERGLQGGAMTRAKGWAMAGIGEEIGQLLDGLDVDRALWMPPAKRIEVSSLTRRGWLARTLRHPSHNDRLEQGPV